MPIDVTAVQERLRQAGLDGWLLYDFHGSNPIATRLAGLSDGRHMTTRRWYYLIPASGQPRGLVHAIERHNLDGLPGERLVYAGRQQLENGLTRLLSGMTRVAMEYSPMCAIPYVSRVDAGTVEMVRARGVEVLSSGDLVQQFEARWTPEQLASHRDASASLYRIKDRAFQEAADALRRGRSLNEYQLQQQMVRWFEDEGLVSDSPPVVAVGGNAGDPHYLPAAGDCRAIVANEVLLLDLWGKKPDPGAVFADITWVAVTSARVPGEVSKAFHAVALARDAAVELVVGAARDGRDLHGWEVDRAARVVLADEGYADRIVHRTGHSLGENVHGNGAHMDDYETHDDRQLLPGTGFTIEPGLYFESFGVRTEINVYRGEHEALVTGPRQSEVVTLA
ncbi:MAG TPA: M24 family metallopeptidase [Vicinamibacterales bacterium]|nr:M24 family metallopeptidase [Vicinamibacterales bacterium]